MALSRASLASLPKLALGAAAALAAISLSPGSAQAYVVTVGGVQYDVTYFTGSYDGNTSQFQTAANGGVMPWWGNSNLAGDFASALGSLAGYPNGGFSQYFAYEMGQYPNCYEDFETGQFICAPGSPFVAVNYSSSYVAGVFGGQYSTSDSAAYSQATLYNAPAAPVPAASAPGPLPLLGAGAAFGFSRKLRKRIKLAPGAFSSALPRA